MAKVICSILKIGAVRIARLYNHEWEALLSGQYPSRYMLAKFERFQRFLYTDYNVIMI
jgi:hypothetical protein